jgi:putative ABC transport system permease protein
VPLTDSLIADIEAIDGVRVAYPEIGFPSQVVANDRTIIANAEAIPMAFGDIAAYQPEVGQFFTSPVDSALLISRSMAERLGFDDPAAAVGDTVTLRTATLDFAALQNPGALLARGLSALPLQEVDYAMRVAGLLPASQQPVSGFTRVLVPIERAEQMEKVTFFSTLDLLLRSGPTDGYAALRVQLDDASQHAQVRQQIEALGVYATSFREQFDRLEQLFLIMDLALAIIGIIALVIATIGIANTVMMNVRERYREIGVMKAIGGDERDLQRLFVLESGLLGVGGSLAGLTFGWLIVLAMDAAVNAYLQQQGFPPISVFRASVPMALGILAVAVSISLAAGIVPARRAARVEPVEALRSV